MLITGSRARLVLLAPLGAVCSALRVVILLGEMSVFDNFCVTKRRGSDAC